MALQHVESLQDGSCLSGSSCMGSCMDTKCKATQPSVFHDSYLTDLWLALAESSGTVLFGSPASPHNCLVS